MKLINYLKEAWLNFISNQYWAENYNEKEDYYTNKYPFKNMLYKRTDKLGEQNIDVCLFCNPNNFQLPYLTAFFDHDDVALDGLKWIIDNIHYQSDQNVYKRSEYWAFGYETLNSKRGDCEDGAILLYDILRHNFIPSWKLRISAGWVQQPGSKKKVGHAYLTYYVEKHDKWVLLDWCYYPNKLPVHLRPDYKEEEAYGNVWFSFNEDYSWTTGLNADARGLLND